ncbi:hypothetical protein HK097_006456 [Rhizophlyctis rosea]|uniref:Uncharacterized protein n=1 Tax=Rhizophlyctis rosea TaxID=64517 RepID=A0AAD5SED7_9FUNG|nr:hypothetical protein HK097_006456 [Rhizophlyctis rosea]
MKLTNTRAQAALNRALAHVHGTVTEHLKRMSPVLEMFHCRDDNRMQMRAVMVDLTEVTDAATRSRMSTQQPTVSSHVRAIAGKLSIVFSAGAMLMGLGGRPHGHGEDWGKRPHPLLIEAYGILGTFIEKEGTKEVEKVEKLVERTQGNPRKDLQG